MPHMECENTHLQTFAAPMSPAEHDAINSETAFRFIRAIAVEKAALDQNLDPSCIRVLAAISYFMHSGTRRAWPGYERIAEITGYSFDRIERAIKRLKCAGYIFSQRRSPISGGRALVHYGLNGIRPRDVDDMVTAAILAMRGNAEAAHPGKKSGVTSPRQKEQGDNSDPGVFTASDPGVFADSNPIRKEPFSKREGEPPQQTALIICDSEPPFADTEQSSRYELARIGIENPTNNQVRRMRSEIVGCIDRHAVDQKRGTPQAWFRSKWVTQPWFWADIAKAVHEELSTGNTVVDRVDRLSRLASQVDGVR
ncbi:MAG: hypothetical protein CTY31_12295 [Hyphomicrobium sp.]|nr:MAG: hypothetical protein CTY39_08105 [Hyphomicrobium sp.]PPC98792.1 MAG: hypothetical protein CTY31_12295 [Hyphomicrobium sp.]